MEIAVYQYNDSLTALGVESVDDLKELDDEDFERLAGMRKDGSETARSSIAAVRRC